MVWLTAVILYYFLFGDLRFTQKTDMANILKYAEARQQPNSIVAKQQRLIKEMILSDVNVAASLQPKILGNERIQVDREQERLNRKRDLENLQHWTLEQKARLEKLKIDHFNTALHRSVSTNVAVDSYYPLHKDLSSPLQSCPTRGVSPKKSSSFKAEVSNYYPGKSAIPFRTPRPLAVRSMCIPNYKAKVPGLFDDEMQPVPHSTCSTSINIPIPNKKDYAMQLITEEKSSLSCETFNKLMQCVKGKTNSLAKEASSVDKDYAMKVIMEEKLFLSNETLTKLIKDHSTSIDLHVVGPTSALQQTDVASTGSKVILDYALKMIIAEKSFLSDETLTKLIQCISDGVKHLNQAADTCSTSDSISDYALKLILKEKSSLSDETLTKLIQFATRNTTEVEQNVVDQLQEVSNEGFISDYAIKVIMEEKMSLSDETLIKLIKTEKELSERPIASPSHQYKPTSQYACGQPWHATTLTGIEDKIQKWPFDSTCSIVLEKLVEDKSEPAAVGASHSSSTIEKEQSHSRSSVVADELQSLASISTSYSTSTSDMASECNNKGNQVHFAEGSHLLANQSDVIGIEYNFDEAASIVTNDRELKQDKPVFESASKSKFSIRKMFSRKSSSLQQVTSESPRQHRSSLIVRSLSQVIRRARSAVFKSHR